MAAGQTRTRALGLRGGPSSLEGPGPGGGRRRGGPGRLVGAILSSPGEPGQVGSGRGGAVSLRGAPVGEGSGWGYLFPLEGGGPIWGSPDGGFGGELGARGGFGWGIFYSLFRGEGQGRAVLGGTGSSRGAPLLSLVGEGLWEFLEGPDLRGRVEFSSHLVGSGGGGGVRSLGASSSRSVVVWAVSLS